MAKAAKKTNVESDLSHEAIALLRRMDEATVSGGYIYVATNEVATLVELGYALVNPELIEAETGRLAAKTTENGHKFALTQTSVEPAPIVHIDQTTKKEDVMTKANVAHEFEVEDVEISRMRAPRAGARIWPFDKLAVGQSFHIPPTEKVPEPAKVYTSTISITNLAHEPKHFSIVRVTDKDPKGVGARVVRNPDFTPEELAKRAAKSAKRKAEREAKEAAMTPEERAARAAKKAVKIAAE